MELIDRRCIRCGSYLFWTSRKAKYTDIIRSMWDDHRVSYVKSRMTCGYLTTQGRFIKDPDEISTYRL